jgi:hypothetical protein
VRRSRQLVTVITLAWLIMAALPVMGGDEEVGPVSLMDPDVVAGTPSLVVDGEGMFTENLGQWESHVRFVATTPFGQVVLSDDGVMYDVGTEEGGHRVRVTFDGARSVKPAGLGTTGGALNYLIGSDPEAWIFGATSYREVVYTDAWPGVDVRYYFRGADLKYDVVVGPYAEVGQVGFTVDGHRGLKATEKGLEMFLSEDLVLGDSDLVAHYEDGQEADVSFVTDGDTYGFAVDKALGRGMVIDPLVMPASTLLGGAHAEEVADMAIDTDGNVYVVGTTNSVDFPVTAGAYSTTYHPLDVVVTKMDRNLTQVLWSTYIGGSEEEWVMALDLDDENNVHLIGETKSSDFPVTEGALQEAIGNQYTKDVYILRLSPDGSTLDHSTFVGGYWDEEAGDIEARDGKIYVAMNTASSDFPYGNISGVMYGAPAILMVLNEDASGIESIMSWGGSRTSKPSSLHVNGEGNVTMAGMTAAWDFPTTPGAYMEEGNYNFRSFLLQADPDANVTNFATYFGVGYVTVTDMAIDDDGYIYLSGYALTTTAFETLEITEGAYKNTTGGRSGAFITKRGLRLRPERERERPRPFHLRRRQVQGLRQHDRNHS